MCSTCGLFKKKTGHKTEKLMEKYSAILKNWPNSEDICKQKTKEQTSSYVPDFKSWKKRLLNF